MSRFLAQSLLCASILFLSINCCSGARTWRKPDAVQDKGAFHLDTTDVWQQDDSAAPVERGLAWKDEYLAHALLVQGCVGAFDEVSAERRRAMDEAETMKARNQAMGIGERRKTTCHREHDRENPNFSMDSIRGDHEENEDALWWLDTSAVAAFGVFDGHFDPHASDILATELLRAFPANWLAQLRQKSKNRFHWEWSTFLLKWFDHAQMTMRNQASKSGTTGSIVIADKLTGIATVAWVGDSQILHLRRSAKRIWQQHWFSSPHQCDTDAVWKAAALKAECNQKDDSKPYVCSSGSGGQRKSCIGVTRTIGDFAFLDEHMVLSTPELISFPVQPGDLLIVASDGLWDTVSADEVLDKLNDHPAFGWPTNECNIDLHTLTSTLSVIAGEKWKTKGHFDDTSIVSWCMPALNQRRHQPRKSTDVVELYEQTLDLFHDMFTGFNLADSGLMHLSKEHVIWKKENYDLYEHPPAVPKPESGTMAAFLEKGQLGEPCQIVRQRHIISIFLKKQVSTCGKHRASEWMLKDIAKNKTISSKYVDIDMKCYSDDGGSTSLDPGAFGRCGIPTGMPCDNAFAHGGCRAGRRCLQANVGSIKELPDEVRPQVMMDGTNAPESNDRSAFNYFISAYACS